MELRTAVSIARHLAHCANIRQKTLLTVASTARNLIWLQSAGAVHHRPLCLQFQFHSTSLCGQRLKSQNCRTNMHRLLTVTNAMSYESKSLVCVAGSISTRGMAGHSKWANIRHIKAAKDGQKSRVIHEYTRKMRAFMRETGQTDPKTSSQLAKLIAEAKSKNVPNANIDRVITQMTGLKNTAPIMFTAKGPSGSVMLVEALSAKVNLTKAELQSIVKKCGFTMFDSGSLARMSFEEKGVVEVSPAQDGELDMEQFVDMAIEAGAEDVVLEDDQEGNKVLQFICEPGEVYRVKKALEGQRLEVSSAEVVYTATSVVSLDSSLLDLMSKAMDKLDEHPDVLRVYTNVEEAS